MDTRRLGGRGWTDAGGDLTTRGIWAGTLLALALGMLFFGLLYAPSPLIYDADSYYHLAIARHYAENGVAEPPAGWVRYGLLSRQFGDKELLFHLALAPFARWPGGDLGGRLALALLGALVLAAIANLSLRAVGAWGLWVPFWLAATSTELTWRLVRLRPELLSLLLLLLALWAAARRRYRVLGVLALVYALSYTAIHAFVGLFALVFVAEAWRRRRWEWGLVAYPLLGAGLGLLIHPRFPDNLAVWWFQSFEFFRLKGVLDVGTEIRPNFTDVVLMANLGWLLGMAILWRSAAPGEEREEPLPPAPVFGVAAAVFGALYLLMSRFSIYFFPFATLWLLFELRRRGRRLGAWTALPWRGRVPAAVAWLACLLVALPVARGELARYRQRNDPGPGAARVSDREAFAAAVPAGARVAAPWRSTPIYLYSAPQASYLNALDPMFLAAVEPEIHALQERLFDGDEPDVPLAVGRLDSRYLAFPSAGGSRLAGRLANDPRVTALHRGVHNLYRIEPGMQASFVLDWRVAPEGASPRAATVAEIESWPRYPRLDPPIHPELRLLEGFVDAARVTPRGGCALFARLVDGPSEPPRRFELASSGPATLWLDGEPLLELLSGSGAVLGRGSVVDLRLAPGTHRLAVRACPPGGGDGAAGFYLRGPLNGPAAGAEGPAP